MVKHIALLTLALLIGCGNPADEPDDVEPVPTVEPTAVPTPQPTATQSPTPKPSPKPSPTIAPPLVPPATCSIVPKTSNQGGQFVNNPNSDKGTLKIIWPNRYTDKIVDVTVWGEPGYFEKLERHTPNEYNDRERYYGKRQVAEYPAPLVVGALLADGNRVCVTLADPKDRVDLRLD